jgi:hypothetical protein
MNAQDTANLPVLWQWSMCVVLCLNQIRSPQSLQQPFCATYISAYSSGVIP